MDTNNTTDNMSTDTKPVVTDQESTPTPQEGEGNSLTLDRSYVEGIRAEAAKWRLQLRETEAKLSELQKAQMTDIEKAQTVAKEAEAKARELETNLQKERFRNAVLSKATRAKFADPEDAYRMIDPETVKIDDDGTPNTQSLEGALNRLIKDKPYLLATTTGGGDGGPRGQTNDQQQIERVNAIANQIQAKGGVSVRR